MYARVSKWVTLALIMVGLGSRMPCIFLSAGITKRLHVTTADTGLPAKTSDHRFSMGKNVALHSSQLTACFSEALSIDVFYH